MPADIAGVPVADLCRKHGLSSPKFYKCKAMHDALNVSEARRLKALEDETPATSSAPVRRNKLTIVSRGARDARAAARCAPARTCIGGAARPGAPSGEFIPGPNGRTP
jgi:hypothetical protein